MTTIAIILAILVFIALQVLGLAFSVHARKLERDHAAGATIDTTLLRKLRLWAHSSMIISVATVAAVLYHYADSPVWYALLGLTAVKLVYEVLMFIMIAGVTGDDLVAPKSTLGSLFHIRVTRGDKVVFEKGTADLD